MSNDIYARPDGSWWIKDKSHDNLEHRLSGQTIEDGQKIIAEEQEYILDIWPEAENIRFDWDSIRCCGQWEYKLCLRYERPASASEIREHEAEEVVKTAREAADRQAQLVRAEAEVLRLRSLVGPK